MTQPLRSSQSKKPVTLARQQAAEQFSKLYQQEDNTLCFQCGTHSKQWAEPKHAIFICLNCAAIYRQVSKTVKVKSVDLDNWTDEQIERFQFGGNKKFKEFLSKYDLIGCDPKVIFRSKAAEYYRRFLKAQIKGTEIPQAPSVAQGREVYVQAIPIDQMTPEQVLEETKERLTWVGKKGVQYGGKAVTTVSYKITSGELKEDAKSAATKVGKAAKSFWSFVANKVGQLQKK